MGTAMRNPSKRVIQSTQHYFDMNMTPSLSATQYLRGYYLKNLISVRKRSFWPLRPFDPITIDMLVTEAWPWLQSLRIIAWTKGVQRHFYPDAAFVGRLDLCPCSWPCISNENGLSGSVDVAAWNCVLDQRDPSYPTVGNWLFTPLAKLFNPRQIFRTRG